MSGSNTLLSSPWGLTVDGSGNIYENDNNSVTVYPPRADGNVSSSATISGAATTLSGPSDVAFL